MVEFPVLKTAVPVSLSENQTIEDIVRASTRNLQRVAAEMPGSGLAGVVYLGFDGTTGKWKLNKEETDPKSLGRILVPYHGLFESCVEWAGGSPLQKERRQLLGVEYDAPMDERHLKKPLSPGAYKKENDGPTYQLGFLGIMLDDGTNVMFEHGSGGGKKAINALATTATQAIVVFGEMVHPVIELGGKSYDGKYRLVHDPLLPIVGYITDKRAREASTLSDADIIVRPTASRAKLSRKETEAPAI
jgi:hypothetical protein